ncbi:MAG TPA: hypothetical protein VGG75_38105 [Trebonia sp.]
MTETDRILLAQARTCHASAASSDSEARRRRATRDHIVRRLRAADPVTWTLGALAREIGCSKELIAHIVRQEEPGEHSRSHVPVPEVGGGAVHAGDNAGGPAV